jgi:hypothetical protein
VRVFERTPQTCTAEGSFVNEAPCAALCIGGSIGGVCLPGSKQCNDNIPQICDALGQWASGDPCTYVRSGGARNGSYVPGDTRCNSDVPQTCDASGNWQHGTACYNGFIDQRHVRRSGSGGWLTEERIVRSVSSIR